MRKGFEASDLTLEVLVDKLADSLKSYDVYTLALMLLYVLLAILFYPFVEYASSIILLDVFLAVAIGTIVLMSSLTNISFFGMLRRFYVIPIIYVMYDQVHAFVTVVHPVDYDDLLIAADRWIFGADPTVWLHSFSTAWLTEYLQICYFLFYLLPIMQAIELWKKGRIDDLDVFARAMTFCYFISYVAYFAMPAIGPRFTLHDFSQLNVDLPGVALTSIIREAVNTGGGLAQGVSVPSDVVNRDCMPSGHTMLTLVNILLGFRFGSRFKWFFMVVGCSLIFSTVYLRYHYVVDVIVGIVLALTTLPLEPYVNQWVTKSGKKGLSLWKSHTRNS